MKRDFSFSRAVFYVWMEVSKISNQINATRIAADDWHTCEMWAAEIQWVFVFECKSLKIVHFEITNRVKWMYVKFYPNICEKIERWHRWCGLKRFLMHCKKDFLVWNVYTRPGVTSNLLRECETCLFWAIFIIPIWTHSVCSIYINSGSCSSTK